MENHKLELAKRDGIALQYSDKSADESKAIIDKIESYMGNDLSSMADALLVGVIPANWRITSYTVNDILLGKIASLECEESCIIIWDKSSASYVNTQNLIRYFDYYWYESSDDIFITHYHSDNILFVRHDGVIFQYAHPV